LNTSPDICLIDMHWLQATTHLKKINGANNEDGTNALEPVLNGFYVLEKSYAPIRVFLNFDRKHEKKEHELLPSRNLYFLDEPDRSTGS